MKRSLMVLKLAEMLSETTLMCFEPAADEILARLEKAGMLPPIDPDTMDTYPIIKWEPEDPPKPVQNKVQVVISNDKMIQLDEYLFTEEETEIIIAFLRKLNESNKKG